MKKILLIAMFPVLSRGAYAQTSFTKDLDHDQVQDSVFYDKHEGTLTVKLSSRDFQSVSGRPFPANMYHWAEDQSVSAAGKDFSVEMDFLGANIFTRNRTLFEYDKREKKIRLKKMRITSSGSGNSVEASVNILTNAFQAQWVLYDRQDQIRDSLPVIKTRMDFPDIFLAGYDGRAFKKFEDAVDSAFDKATEKSEKGK